MFSEKLDESYIVTQDGTSEGTQIKYYKDGFWYKKDSRGKEGFVEYLVSKLLSFSDLRPEEYVQYETGTINGNPGCRSRNFLSDGEELVTLYRLYYNEFGKDLSKVIDLLETMEKRIGYVTNFIKQSYSFDPTSYFQKIFTLDMLVLNEDRHLNNLALVFDGESFKAAPIFDQGISLLTANKSIRKFDPLEENVKRVIARPFSGSHEKMQAYFGTGFSLNTKAALQWLATEPVCMETEALKYQIERYRHLF